MNKIIDDITKFITDSNVFKFQNITSSYYRQVGDSISFSVDNSRNTTNDNMGATILDGILQAGLNYEKVVKPRIEKFKKEYPKTTTTSQFYELINSKDLSELINFKGKKIDRIITLTIFLKNEKIETENDFYTWLSDDKNILVLSTLNGIGDKTVNYFKILTGHKDTVAVDVHLRKFVSKFNNDIEFTDNKIIIEILKDVAKNLNIDAATLDYSIWAFMAKDNGLSKISNKK